MIGRTASDDGRRELGPALGPSIYSDTLAKYEHAERADPSARYIDIDMEHKVDALRIPDTYPEATARIETIETHFAWIFLTDHFAYKLKKPIRADRLDHTTLALREHACREELRLNRRLAHSIYMSVVPLTFDPALGIALNGNGRVIDWLVKMHRLPRHLLLDHAMTAGPVDPTLLAAVGKLLAGFHAAQPKAHMSAADYLFRLRRRIEELHDDLLAPDLRLTIGTIEQLKASLFESLAALRNELGERPMRGGIVDAHGDLRPEHVFLGEPLCVIDALEFCADLRLLDPVEDLAFLFVECAQAGHDEVGTAILKSYRTTSTDAFSLRLFDFYCSLRAANRAKLVAWHLRETARRTQQDWRATATIYVERAIEYAARARRG